MGRFALALVPGRIRPVQGQTHRICNLTRIDNVHETNRRTDVAHVRSGGGGHGAPRQGPVAPTPDDAVNRLFQAAQRGDAPAYLAALTGPLRILLRVDAIADRRRSLCRQPAGIGSGHERARHQPRGEASPDRAELDVELVFPDRNQRQRFVLLRQSGGWLIARSTRPIRSSRPSLTVHGF